jgi:hypothetical protein
MATQTVTACPLNVVLRPGSDAASDFRSAVLAPGFESHPSLNLRYLGGKTIPRLTWVTVYLGHWDPADCTQLDRALAAAMSDAGLNNVLAQYFAGEEVTARFAGSRSIPDSPGSVDQAAVEELVARLDSDGVLAGHDRRSSAMALVLPRGAVLRHGGVTSEQGLGGFHGSVHVRRGGRRRETVYYAVAVYSEGSNGIVAFHEPWQNVCATVYHELQEIRTDPDVEDAIRAGATPASERLLGWYSPHGGEIGDMAIVMEQVPLADGSGTVPVQLMWSNAVGGPEGPISRPHPPR